MGIFGNQAAPGGSGTAGTEETAEHVAKAAMFLAGLKILQTMNLCFAGSFPTLLRFGISPSKIGPFIGITGSCLNFWAAVGDITGFFLGLLNMLAYLFPAGFSIFTTVALFIVQCRLTFICLRCSGYDGVRKYFYWLCFSALLYQGDALLCTATWGLQSAYFFFALELTSVLIPVVHAFAAGYLEDRGGGDLLTVKLNWQLGSMVFFTGVCVCAWILCFIGNCDRKGCKGNADNAGEAGANNCSASAGDLKGAFEGNPAESGIRCFHHKQTKAALFCKEKVTGPTDGSATDKIAKGCSVISPFFMGIIGMGSIFWLFPVICPFMVCHYSHFEFTQKFLLVLGAVATLIAWFINETNHGILNEPILKGGGTNFDKWKFAHWADNDGAWWNLTWLIMIPVVFFTWVFFTCLHSPTGFFGRSILHCKWAVVFGSLHFFLTQLFKAFGLNGVFANAFVTAKLGALGNISFMLSMIHLVASLFTNQAYSEGYASFKCALDSGFSWPTQGLGGLRSYLWWHRYGVSNGAKTFFRLRRIDIVAVIS